jgi:hypothetical protein
MGQKIIIISMGIFLKHEIVKNCTFFVYIIQSWEWNLILKTNSSFLFVIHGIVHNEH